MSTYSFHYCSGLAVNSIVLELPKIVLSFSLQIVDAPLIK